MGDTTIVAKEVLRIKDLMELLGLSYSAAQRLMREVKANRDCLGIRGLIHRSDWIAYCERNDKEAG